MNYTFKPQKLEEEIKKIEYETLRFISFEMSGNLGFGLRRYTINYKCHPDFKDIVDNLINDKIMNLNHLRSTFKWKTGEKNQNGIYV